MSHLITLIDFFCLNLIDHSRAFSGAPLSLIAQATSNQPFYLTNDFLTQLTVGIVITFCGGLLGYFLGEKQRRKELAVLSYKNYGESVLKFKKEVEKNIGKKVSFIYDGNQEIKDLYLMTCNLVNSGNKPVKNEYITFEFSPKTIRLLNSYFEPKPNPKIGVEEVSLGDSEGGNLEKRYLIRDLLPQQKIGLQFIIARDTKEEKEEPILFVSNDRNSKIELSPADVTIATIQKQLERFIVLSLLFLFVPPIFQIIPLIYGSLVSGVARIAILIYLIPSIGQFSRIISELITNLTVNRQHEVNQYVTQEGKFNVTIGEGIDLFIGDSYKKLPESQEAINVDATEAES